ncbi:MAG TPA: trigger factor [Oscillospiraceae bacterium]|nr:trigger factor [Oscillospiraceae bacterium]HRW57627.1 trigger factor [Oscillospiraceae bacterium]
MELTHFEKTGANECKLTVSVNAEEFNRAIESAYQSNAKKLTVPGFRKGKAPRALIEKYYPKEHFYQDAIRDSYPEAYEYAVEQAGIEPVDRAEIELLDCSADGYSFTATVTVKPDVEVKNYTGIEAKKTVKTVTDTQVEAELDKLRTRNARLVDVEDRPAQMGDRVTLDYDGYKDDVAFDGGKGENYELELGSNTFIPGFEEQIVGHGVGEEFDVNVTFPEDYHEESLKGAAAVFKCKVNKVQFKDVPAADDEFAKDVSEFDTLDELKAEIKRRNEERNASESDMDVENQLVDAVLANTTVEVPEVMYEIRMGDMMEDFESRLRQSGLDLESYLMYTGSDKEKYKEGFRPQAERQVKIRLALEKIAKLEGMDVTDEEYDDEYKKLAEKYGMKEEEVRAAIPAKDLKQDLLVEKAIKFVRDHAKITEAAEGEEAAPAPKKRAAKKKPAKEAETAAAPAEETPAEPAVEKPAEEAAAEEAPAPKKRTVRKKKSDIDMDID